MVRPDWQWVSGVQLSSRGLDPSVNLCRYVTFHVNFQQYLVLQEQVIQNVGT